MIVFGTTLNAWARTSTEFLESDTSQGREKLYIDPGVVVGGWKIPDDLANRIFNKPALHSLVRGKPRDPAKKEASERTVREI
ncbi:hypothetical protein GH789_04735 [Rhizobium pusense]|uniref:hypothetical protein n=1 Tax=Agrobacterium pusense TaxID=648995 RepID=UPI000DD722B1|nr:hypothetical protein [Agrobacterium pusense]MRG64591.1 hypothetical protein [Agrobacterium pusense]